MANSVRSEISSNNIYIYIYIEKNGQVQLYRYKLPKTVKCLFEVTRDTMVASTFYNGFLQIIEQIFLNARVCVFFWDKLLMSVEIGLNEFIISIRCDVSKGLVSQIMEYKRRLLLGP